MVSRVSTPVVFTGPNIGGESSRQGPQVSNLSTPDCCLYARMSKGQILITQDIN